jgi:hypothetical protein
MFPAETGFGLFFSLASRAVKAFSMSRRQVVDEINVNREKDFSFLDNFDEFSLFFLLLESNAMAINFHPSSFSYQSAFNRPIICSI